MIRRTKLSNQSSVLAASLAALFLLTAGCGGGAKEQEPVVSVQTTPAGRETISQVVSAEAVVYPLEQATISPKITAPITEFKVQRGDPVKKGQILAILENKDLEGQAQASKGNFEQADATYKTSVDASIPQQVQKAELDAAAAKTAFDAQQRVYDSRKELFQQGALPQRDLDAAAVALAQAKAAYEEAEKVLADLKRLGREQALKAAHGSLDSAKGQMQNAEAQLSYSVIRSPIDGVVTDRPLYAGETATANQPILTVMNLNRIIAKAHVPYSEAAALKQDDPAQLKVPGLDDPIKGRVSKVSPALDPGSTTIEIWVEAAKPNPALKPGMTVQVAMTAKTVKDAIVVPASAVFKNDQGADYVVLAGSDEKAHQKIVHVGVKNSEDAQILSGVNVGDPIITSGGYGLPDNTQIKVEKPGAEDKEAADKGDKDNGKQDDVKDAKDTKKADKKDAKSAGSAKAADKDKEKE
jgi:multidrug efflux pump subunit AcrA (membrane-fusion protein)